jgi:hypothetical protein
LVGQMTGIGQAGENVLARQSGVVLDDGLL